MQGHQPQPAAALSRGKRLTRRFRRNELKNLARRKGYRLERYYCRWFKAWFYRIKRLPWPSMRERLQSYEYCPTEAASAAFRVFTHLSNKPDMRYLPH